MDALKIDLMIKVGEQGRAHPLGTLNICANIHPVALEIQYFGLDSGPSHLQTNLDLKSLSFHFPSGQNPPHINTVLLICVKDNKQSPVLLCLLLCSNCHGQTGKIRLSRI